MEGLTFCIKLNTGQAARFCALCRRRADSKVGLKIFVEGTGQMLCASCGEERAPELTALLALNSQVAAGATADVAALPAVQW